MLLTHRGHEPCARAQPGTPRHVTARAGASREPGPARGPGGREVAPARAGLPAATSPKGSGPARRAAPTSTPTHGAGGGEPGQRPSFGDPGHEAWGSRSRFRSRVLPGRTRRGGPTTSCFCRPLPTPSPRSRGRVGGATRPGAGVPRPSGPDRPLLRAPGSYEWLPARAGAAGAGAARRQPRPRRAPLGRPGAGGGDRGGPRCHVGRCRGGVDWPGCAADGAFRAR